MILARRLDADDLARVDALVGERWERFRNARLLLTGGTGFVGRWLLASLLEANGRRDLRCRVTIPTRNPQRARDRDAGLFERPEVELVEGDVRTLDRVDGIADARFDHLIHAATDVGTAADPLDTFTTCVEGTRQVLDLARRSAGARVLLVSSGAVYGPPAADAPASIEDQAGGPAPFRASAAYAEGKRASECLAAAMADRHGVPVTVARCFAFVGPLLPLDGGFAIGNFIRQALAGQTIEIRGDGTPVRSYLHASDMAAWLWILAADGRAGTAYNVGSDRPVALRELAERVAALAGSSAGVRVAAERSVGLAPDRYLPDVDRIRSEFAIAPPLSLDDSIARTLRWYRGDTERTRTVHRSEGPRP